MKRTTLAGLFIAAAMLASPVFAADNNLCTSKLQELKGKVNALPATATNTSMEIKRLMSSAEASQASGDDKNASPRPPRHWHLLTVRATNQTHDLWWSTFGLAFRGVMTYTVQACCSLDSQSIRLGAV